MKCLNCGTRVKKSEEICPECGAYITKKKAAFTTEIPLEEDINAEELEKAEKYVRNIENNKPEKYDYKDYLLFPSIIKIGGGILLLAIVIFSFADRPYYIGSRRKISNIICFFASLFSIFLGVATIIQEKKCFLNITSDRVCGRIPIGFFDTEDFDISIDDIIAVNETGFHTRHSNAEVHIVTKEREYVVKGSSETMLSDFSDKLNYNIISKENSHED